MIKEFGKNIYANGLLILCGQGKESYEHKEPEKAAEVFGHKP